jgi:predicted nucleic-acid-binding Zn-ribbon protein
MPSHTPTVETIACRICNTTLILTYEIAETTKSRRQEADISVPAFTVTTCHRCNLKHASVRDHDPELVSLMGQSMVLGWCAYKNASNYFGINLKVRESEGAFVCLPLTYIIATITEGTKIEMLAMDTELHTTVYKDGVFF